MRLSYNTYLPRSLPAWQPEAIELLGQMARILPVIPGSENQEQRVAARLHAMQAAVNRGQAPSVRQWEELQQMTSRVPALFHLAARLARFYPPS